MYGWGVVKTLAITIFHFVMTYVEDLRRLLGGRSVAAWSSKRQGPSDRGIFTVQYPQERRPLPERTRNLPFLVSDAETEALRCTACGMCARVCPVQCIWIERAVDPETNRPLRFPEAYHLDVSLCMGCGYCADFCPFDAIKMDHDFEVASYERPGFRRAEELAKPEAYHARLHPLAYAEEEHQRAARSKKH
jgi:NADH-quinone oxidoreductase subunit I